MRGADALSRDSADACDRGCRAADLLAAALHDGSLNRKRTPARVIPVTGDGAAIADLSAPHRGVLCPADNGPASVPTREFPCGAGRGIGCSVSPRLMPYSM